MLSDPDRRSAYDQNSDFIMSGYALGDKHAAARFLIVELNLLSQRKLAGRPLRNPRVRRKSRTACTVNASTAWECGACCLQLVQESFLAVPRYNGSFSTVTGHCRLFYVCPKWVPHAKTEQRDPHCDDAACRLDAYQVPSSRTFWCLIVEACLSDDAKTITQLAQQLEDEPLE